MLRGSLCIENVSIIYHWCLNHLLLPLLVLLGFYLLLLLLIRIHAEPLGEMLVPPVKVISHLKPPIPPLSALAMTNNVYTAVCCRNARKIFESVSEYEVIEIEWSGLLRQPSMKVHVNGSQGGGLTMLLSLISRMVKRI